LDTETRADRAERIRKELYSKHLLDAREVDSDALPITKEVMALASDIAWGEIWSRPGLSRNMRSVASLSVVVALGRMDQVRFHVNVALNNGLTPEEIVEVLLHVGFYAGLPANAAAQEVATAVFRERGVIRGAAPTGP
jgi:alkylhydroperoxidase/carboxymuconolactone decarboxylase family protein YurZ